MSKVKVPWVTEWVTRSPIELFWTAKKLPTGSIKWPFSFRCLDFHWSSQIPQREAGSLLYVGGKLLVCWRKHLNWLCKGHLRTLYQKVKLSIFLHKHFWHSLLLGQQIKLSLTFVILSPNPSHSHCGFLCQNFQFSVAFVTTGDSENYLEGGGGDTETEGGEGGDGGRLVT